MASSWRNIIHQSPFSISCRYFVSSQGGQTYASLVPFTSFCLGTWQVFRKKEKELQIARLRKLKFVKPVELPETREEVEKLEYRPVRVRGHFIHEKELYRGPRGLFPKSLTNTFQSFVYGGLKTTQGYLVITPFKLADREETILVNRGWVPRKRKRPFARMEGQIQGTVELIGIVRRSQARPLFRPPNNIKKNKWYYRDIDAMARVTGASPIYLDATHCLDVPNGPIGGQTRYLLRNRHGHYIMTWYGMTLTSTVVWCSHAFKLRKL